MSNQWIRLYREALHDPKIVTLTDRQHRAWVNMLMMADDDGFLPSFRDIACHLRTTAVEATQLVNEIIEAGLVDPVLDVSNADAKRYRIHGWEARQYRSDNSTERVAKYRAKRKEAGLPVLGDYSKFRSILIKRDGCACVYCEAEDRKLVVDHMVPISLGGTDDTDNLALACKECNSGKAGRTPENAGLSIASRTAADALSRYLSRRVTVTVTPPEPEADTETESEPVQTRERAKAGFDFGNVTGSVSAEVEPELIRRAEGLGLNARAIEGECYGGKVKNPSAYFQSLCRKQLRTMLPGLNDDVIGRGLCGDQKAYAALMNLIVTAEATR